MDARPCMIPGLYDVSLVCQLVRGLVPVRRHSHFDVYTLVFIQHTSERTSEHSERCAAPRLRKVSKLCP